MQVVVNLLPSPVQEKTRRVNDACSTRRVNDACSTRRVNDACSTRHILFSYFCFLLLLLSVTLGNTHAKE